MSKNTWSKKEGLDLRWDKNKILKKELKQGRKSKEVPQVQEPQVHKSKENYHPPKSGYDVIDHEKFKKSVMPELTSLGSISDINARCKRLRKIEGMLFYLVNNGGSFTEQEASKIVNAYMICRERSDPNHHPLQTSVVTGREHNVKNRTNGGASIQNGRIFSDRMVKRELNKQGFYLNIGPFSASESLTLMKNVEKFLTRHGCATDGGSIWNLLNDDFISFYRRTQMFLYIGKNLNRSSYQINSRLFSMYHPYATGKSDAKTDARIMTRMPELVSLGVHKKHKILGEEVNRYRGFIAERYRKLTSEPSSFNKQLQRDIVKLIAKQQECSVKDIVATGIDFVKIATELNVNVEVLRSYWRKEGERICVRASLPRWKLEDSLALLKAIENEGEEDENCIDFKNVHDRLFRGKVQNWEHLREHYNRVRRVVPYYMLNDLQSTLAAAIKAIKEKLEKSVDGEKGEVDVKEERDTLEEDEDNFID